jgi:hypothetical protein
MDHHKILGGPANVVELGHRGGSIEYAYTWDIWMIEYAYTCCASMFSIHFLVVLNYYRNFMYSYPA